MIEKAEIQICEPQMSDKTFTAGAPIDTLRLTFNPKEYTLSLQAGWSFKAQKKDAAGTLEYSGTQPRDMKFEVFVDESEIPTGPVLRNVPDTVGLLAKCVEPTEKSVQSGTPFPPILKFGWGMHNEFTGVMKSLQARYTMFKGNGQPIRAVCQIGLTEFKQGSIKQNPTSGGRRARRSHEVVLGDTLMSVSYQEYGTPTWWRALAIENRIENPMRLPTGTMLLVPPADEAKALR